MGCKIAFFLRYLSNRSLICGLLLTNSIILIGIAAPVFAKTDPGNVQVSNTFASPSFEHPFGTDNLGRDIWSRVIYGTRPSLQVGTLSVALAFVLGVPIGAFGSYLAGWIDDVIMRVVDAMLAFPAIIVALLLRLVLGVGLSSMIITLAFVYMAVFARAIHGSVLSEKEKTYVLAAYAVGNNTFRIVFRHVLPNVLPPILALATTLVGDAIIIESSLSFIGVGASATEPSWGAMLRDSLQFMQEYPHVAIFPGLVLSFTVLGINLLGYGLQDVLAPNLPGGL